MKVSVIIPTYNEEKEIVECLESLGEQTYDDFEILVVDDGSTDRTEKRVRNVAKAINSLFTLLRQKHSGPGAARNLAAKHAKGEILVFVDADMTFEPDFIENLIDPIVTGIAKGTFSKDEFVSNWNNVWSRCWNVNQNWEGLRRHPKDYPDEDKVFRAILKKEFDKVGGFTPGGYTDDYSLFEKLGYKSKVAIGAKFYHKNPASLTEVFRHAIWVGKRPYKLGYFGYIVALIRASLPISIIVGLYKSFSLKGKASLTFYSRLRRQVLPFTLFKIVYDFGVFIGILTFIFSGKGSK